MKKIHAVQFGCGPIGCAVARLALQRPDIKLVGAVPADRHVPHLGRLRRQSGKPLGSRFAVAIIF
jgi:hypothetical protein